MSTLLLPRNYYHSRVWQQHNTDSQNQFEPPPDVFTIQLHIREFLYPEATNSGRFQERIRPTTYTKSLTVQRRGLISDENSRQVITLLLSRLGLPLDGVQEATIRNFCALARSMTGDHDQAGVNSGRAFLPIVLEVTFLKNWVLYEETEAMALAAMESPEVERMLISHVPASRSSIEALEKSMEQCTICLEKFSVGVEVSRMPCSHVYHGGCIVRWLETNPLCPLCRFPMPC